MLTCEVRAVTLMTHGGQVIIFDSAYSSFITDPACPKSIYEIEVR